MTPENDLLRDTHTDSDETLPVVLKIVLFILAGIIVFVSVDYFIHTPSQQQLTQFFFNGFIHDKFFSLLDLLILFLSFFLIFKYKLGFRHASGAEKFFFWFAILCFVLKMANPNARPQNPVLYLPLFSEISNYSYLILFGTLISIPRKIFYPIFIQFFKYALILAVVRTVFLLLMFAAGQGRSFFFGIRSALLEGDTLLILGFFQSVAFALYLIRKDKLFLFSWIAFILLQIFSTRRSPLFTALFCNAIVFIIYYVRELKPVVKLSIMLGFIALFILLPTVVSDLSPGAKKYVDRYLGVFSTDTYTTDEANSDSGHFKQSYETSKAAMKVGFWGVGYGNKLVLEGAFSINGEYYVHNCYAAIWAFHGIYLLLFYVVLFLVLLYHFFQLTLYSSPDQQTRDFIYIKLAVVVYFLMYMHAMYYTTLNFMMFSKMLYVNLFMIIFILKSSPRHYTEIAGYFLSSLDETQKDLKKFVSFH